MVYTFHFLFFILFVAYTFCRRRRITLLFKLPFDILHIVNRGDDQGFYIIMLRRSWKKGQRNLIDIFLYFNLFRIICYIVKRMYAHILFTLLIRKIMP